MSKWSESKLPMRQNLSSLMDGELDSSSAADALRLWREDAESREAWHAYSLIGDVLRSEELASEASHDASFLANFRARLAHEPVVLAPAEAGAVSAIIPARAHRRGWAAMTAVAAGFVTVAGVVAVLQVGNGASTPGKPPLVSAAAPTAGASVVLASEGAASGFNDFQNIVVNGQLIRDARLDEYLAAHKKFGGSSLPGGPSSLMRSAAVDGAAR